MNSRPQRATSWAPAIPVLAGAPLAAADPGKLQHSFDVTVQRGGGVGPTFDDHDLLLFDLATWTRTTCPGSAQAGTGGADLDAVDDVTAGVFADDFESGDAERWSFST